MNAHDYPIALRECIIQLKRMPGVGSRGAERLALWFLQHGQADAGKLALSLQQIVAEVGYCPQCGFFSEKGILCSACSDPQRDANSICVVEQASDVLPIERCGIYRGQYHCLGGKISPLDGIMPEDLALENLLERVKINSQRLLNERANSLLDPDDSAPPMTEVIIAVGSDVEGEATALYLAEELRGLPCRVSRLAQGMPAGAGLGHADSVTLMRALEGRQII